MSWYQALPLVALFGALFYIWYAVKTGQGVGRWLKTRVAQREIRVIESVSLAARTSLVLVEIRGETFLVTVSPQGTQIIAFKPRSESGADFPAQR